MSLVEVMVAVLVLSVGLLGMGSLLAVSLRNTQSASYRTQAANIAYEYTDTARSYIANGSNSKAGLIALPTFTNSNCDLAVAPAYTCGNDSNALNCDLRRFADRVCRTLPEGRIRAQMTPLAGAARRVQLNVQVCWTDDRSQAIAQTPGCTSPSETLFTLQTEL